jgi:hypothetical protein
MNAKAFVFRICRKGEEVEIIAIIGMAGFGLGVAYVTAWIIASVWELLEGEE